ncbi:hypothetical protein DFH06DRAFT_1015457 [Mycena polygramma]|nr:hypothetical protein DFH06DRAFT_1015457 [Mycena polygramma]
MLSTRQCAYPQLVVSCRGQKVAFSRDSLKSMSHKRASDLFVKRFARPGDYVDVPPKSGGWLPSSAARYSPEVNCFVTFCRTDDVDLRGAIELDASGWADNIGNVRELEVVLTRKSV